MRNSILTKNVISLISWSLFRDRTVSWVRITNGITEYVTETSEEIPTENVDLFISTRKRVAKTKPRPKIVLNLSSKSVPINERKWMDIDPQPFDHSCFEESKFMTRTLRHDSSTPRDEDGAVRFDEFIVKLKEFFVSTLQWTVKTWANSLAQGGGWKKRLQYCLNPFSSNEFLYFRVIQGHSGENVVDPLLQDNIVSGWFRRVHLPSENAYEMHSIIQCGLSLGGKSRQTVSVLHSREPDRHSTWSKRRWIRSGRTQNRTAQTHLEISPKYSIFVHFKAWSEKGVSDSIKLERMQLLFETHYQRFVSIKWFAWKQGKNYTAEFSSHPGYLA